MNNAKDINRYKTALDAFRNKEIDPTQVPDFIKNPVFSAKPCDECDECGGTSGRRKPLKRRKYSDGVTLTLCRVCALEDMIMDGDLDVPLTAVGKLRFRGLK